VGERERVLQKATLKQQGGGGGPILSSDLESNIWNKTDFQFDIHRIKMGLTQKSGDSKKLDVSSSYCAHFIIVHSLFFLDNYFV
jgi:hypothetical protein